jgi:hypothetical protein
VTEAYAFVQLFLGTSSEVPSLLGFNPANEYIKSGSAAEITVV